MYVVVVSVIVVVIVFVIVSVMPVGPIVPDVDIHIDMIRVGGIHDTFDMFRFKYVLKS